MSCLAVPHKPENENGYKAVLKVQWMPQICAISSIFIKNLPDLGVLVCLSSRN